MTATARDWARLAVVVGGYAAALALYLRRGVGGLANPWFVFVAMVCVLGLAFVAEPLVGLRLPAPLRKIRRWETDGRIYAALGVRRFGTLLRRTGLRALNSRVYLPGAANAARVCALLESAEASHVLSAALAAPYIVYAAIRGRWITVIAFSLAQLLLNLYPIAHLRLARHRVERVSGRRGVGRLSAARA